MTSLALPWAEPAVRERALEVLLGPSLEPIVDLVAWSPAPGIYEVASAEGHLRFWRSSEPENARGQRSWHYDSELLSGLSPLARQDPTHFAGLEAERAVSHPPRHLNSYPHALDHLAQLFDHRVCPRSRRLALGRPLLG